MKIRIKFRKYGVMRFIGHLDIMRYFQKAMRRADIDIRYSEGFSPHQIMSFAAPLGVGIISDGEYLDIEVNSTKSSAESIKALNAVMVEGMEVTEYVKLPDHAAKSMSLVAAADYTVYYKNKEENIYTAETMQDAIKEFFGKQDEIIVTKQTKKSETQIDLKPLIYRFEAMQHDGQAAFSLRLASGSVQNIKPELVLETFYKYWNQRWEPFSMQIKRDEVYAQADGSYIPLTDLGEIIP